MSFATESTLPRVGQPVSETDFHEAYFHRDLPAVKRLYGRLFGFPLATNWLRFRQLLRCLPEPMGRVLDVGCGNGYMLFYLAARRPSMSALAIDVDEGVIARNRSIAKRLHLSNVTLQAGSWEDLRVGEVGPFDTILLLDVITEADDRSGLLRRMHELLSPGGHLVLGSALPSSSRFLVDAVDPYWRQPLRAAQIRSLDLYGLLGDAGFHVEVARPIAGLPFGIPAHCVDMLFYKSSGWRQALHAAAFPVLKAMAAAELVLPPLFPTGVALRARR